MEIDWSGLVTHVRAMVHNPRREVTKIINNFKHVAQL